MKLTLLLIPLLFLSSCSIDWKDEKDAKIAELEKQVTELKSKNDDELFKKKQECADYKDLILKDIKDPTYTRYKLDPEITEIFYSPIRKSCVYVYESYPLEKCTNPELAHEDYLIYCIKEVTIIDFLTKETLFLENITKREQFSKCFNSVSKANNHNFDACNAFEAYPTIKKLK